MERMNIGILFGGMSEEHEVSCISAKSIYENIDRTRFNPILIGITKAGAFKYFDGDLKHLASGRWEEAANPQATVDLLGIGGTVGIVGEQVIPIDCFFPVLHGPSGEDGKLQGILEFSKIPYVGCGVLSSAMCMDKEIMKDRLRFYNIPQTKYLIPDIDSSAEAVCNQIEQAGFRYPVFIKPANLGSSVGISKVHSSSELERAILSARKYDKKILVEEGVDCREIEVSVLERGREIYVSSPGELIVKNDFYDYDTKYKESTTEFVIPAKVTYREADEIAYLAREAFKCLCCEGIARVDFFIDKKNGKVLLNEINTMPGFTEISMYPKNLQHDGIEYSGIIGELIDLAVKKHEKK